MKVLKMEIFAKISEKDVTKAIVEGFAEEFIEYIESDVIIVGAGPSGLVAAKKLAENGVKTLIIESNNYLGGGFWIGGYLMNKLTVRAPGQKIFDEIGVPYKEVKEGLFVADGPHACSKLIASAMDAGAKVINMTKFDDVVVREGRVSGTVINWTPVSALPRAITCVDPVAIESKIVIDATGHDAVVVKSLEERGLVDIAGFEGMWVEKSEDAIIEHTKEVYPGLYVTGMSVATTFGQPRMGPTFGGMLLSGEKVAELIIKNLKGNKNTKTSETAAISK
jgi:thiamine thiazole synthase